MKIRIFTFVFLTFFSFNSSHIASKHLTKEDLKGIRDFSCALEISQLIAESCFEERNLLSQFLEGYAEISEAILSRAVEEEKNLYLSLARSIIRFLWYYRVEKFNLSAKSSAIISSSLFLNNVLKLYISGILVKKIPGDDNMLKRRAIRALLFGLIDGINRSLFRYIDLSISGIKANFRSVSLIENCASALFGSVIIELAGGSIMEDCKDRSN